MKTKTLSELYQYEKDLLLKTLQECKGNKIQTAKILGISIKTIYTKLYEYEK